MTGADVLVRVLGPDDAAVLADVASGVFDPPPEPAFVRELLADPRHHLVVAVDGATVVGFASAPGGVAVSSMLSTRPRDDGGAAEPDRCPGHSGIANHDTSIGSPRFQFMSGPRTVLFARRAWAGSGVGA